MQVRDSFGPRRVPIFCSVLTLCWSLSYAAFAQPSAADGQTQARDEYGSGLTAFQQGDDARARQHFAAADAAFPSPNSKLMLGRTLLRLGQPVAAHAALSAALREARGVNGTRYEQTASAAQEELQKLAPHLATITLRVDDPTGRATLHVAGREIPRNSWQEPIACEPGAIEIALNGAEGQSDTKSLEMSGGTAATLAMSIPEHLPPTAAVEADQPALPARVALAPRAAVTASNDSAARTLGYVAAGVGAAGIVAFGVLGAMSNDQFSKLDAACPMRSQCDASLQDHATRGRTYQALGNVSLGVGIAALAAGVVLWVIGLPSEQSHAVPSASGRQLVGTF